MPVKHVGDYFQDGQSLPNLQKAYLKDRDTLVQAMADSLPSRYQLSEKYMDAIQEAFYGALPPDDAAWPRSLLSVKDRERVLIALLGARAERLFLAIHAYVGLMEGISPDEVAHILFLAGIYGGVSSFTAGIDTVVKVLEVLEALGKTNDPLNMHPVAVLKQIIAAFPSWQ